jgi:hypothetical protein
VALLVEDGAGIPDANAYISIPYASQYFRNKRLEAWEALTVDEQEGAIISGTQLVDISFKWKGARKTLEQGLNWPRAGIALDGFPIEGVPVMVKKASAEAAYLSMTNDSLYSDENDKKVISEKVDIIAVTYASAKESGAATKFEVLDKILRGLYIVEPASSSSVGASRVERV